MSHSLYACKLCLERSLGITFTSFSFLLVKACGLGFVFLQGSVGV